MGRAFEKRKHKIFANNAKNARAFTRIGKEIAIAVKLGGSSPEGNPRLRMVMQNAKALNMPKDRVEAAINRAAAKDAKAMDEVIFEGYGPHGVAVLVETATDNNTRTVANIRMYFNRAEGSLGKTGSLDFIFNRKGIFTIEKGNRTLEDLELELIDYGAEEFESDENIKFLIEQYFEEEEYEKKLKVKNIIE